MSKEREVGNRNGMTFNTACGVYMNQLEAKLKTTQLRLKTCSENCTQHELNESGAIAKLEAAEQRIKELEGIINKAKVDPNADHTSESAIDNSYTGQIAQLEATIKQVREYVVHKDGCHSWRGDLIPCTCGLEALIGDES